MKKIMACLIIFSFVICGCEKIHNKVKAPSDWKEVYENYLNKLKTNNDDIEYFMKDLDDNDVPELIITINTKLSIFSFDEKLIESGSHDFITGTTRLLYSEDNSYPGIFYFYVSGGINYYGYITIENKKLSIEKLWNEDFSEISKEVGETRERIMEESDNKNLIKESKKAYKNNNDIQFRTLK